MLIKKSITKNLKNQYLIRSIIASISLEYTYYDFKRQKSMIVHHGLMGSQKNFKSLVHNAFISKHRNSFLIDCRNHGNSLHTQTHRIQDLAKDLVQFIKHLISSNQNSQKQVTLMGHSMGGKTLIALSVLYPEMQNFIDKMIIIDESCTRLQSSKQNNSVFEQTKIMLKRMSQIQLIGRKTKDIYQDVEKSAINKDVAGLFRSDLKILSDNQHKWTTNIKTIAKQYHLMRQFDPILIKRRQKIFTYWKKPVDIVYGSKSKYFQQNDLKYFKQLYPNFNLNQSVHKIEGAGHWVHFDKPKQFLGVVGHILQR